MKPGDLYWADVPFVEGTGSKLRPVLILQKNPDGKAVVLKKHFEIQTKISAFGVA